jgi:hypothetical protein
VGGGGGAQGSHCGPGLAADAPASWGRIYDTTSLQGLVPFQITVDEQGESVLVADASGVDFGTGEIVDQAALAAYGPAGAPIAAVAPDGEVVMGAHFHGPDLYTAGLDSATFDIVLGKRSAALASAWEKRVGVATLDPTHQAFTGPLLEAPDGNLILTGGATSLSWQLGSTALSFGGPDAFVVALDPAGGVLWAKALGLTFDASANGDYAIIRAAAVAPSGTIAIAGAKANINQGGWVSRAFLAELDPTGAILWSRVLSSDVAGVEIAGLAFAPDGAVIAKGIAEGSVDFGGGPISTGPEGHGFTARYDASGALAKVVLETDGCATPFLVGQAPNGDIAVVGVGVAGALYAGTLDPVGLTPSYTRGYAISARFVVAAALAPSGALVVAGEVDGPSDFGQGAVAPNAKLGQQPFLAELP